MAIDTRVNLRMAECKVLENIFTKMETDIKENINMTCPMDSEHIIIRMGENKKVNLVLTDYKDLLKIILQKDSYHMLANISVIGSTDLGKSSKITVFIMKVTLLKTNSMDLENFI